MQRDPSGDDKRDSNDEWAEARPAKESKDAPSKSSRDEPAGKEGDTAERKERVIHTRVPAVLEQELKRLAENIRVPVSNLIRTILEDAVEMADRAGRGVEEELHRAATTLSSKREHILKKKAQSAIAQRHPLDGVIGFQSMTLASDARCARCDSAIDAGDDAHLGVSADPTAPRVVVCDACVPRSDRGKRRG